MKQRNKNTSIFRHLLDTSPSGQLSMAMPLIAVGCNPKTAGQLSQRSRDAREVRPVARLEHPKLGVSQIFGLT